MTTPRFRKNITVAQVRRLEDGFPEWKTAGLPINQIHDVTGALVDRVKEKFPQIHRVTIHPEPFEER